MLSDDTIPSGMSDLSDLVVDVTHNSNKSATLAVCGSGQKCKKQSTSSSSDINVEEFRQQINNYGRTNPVAIDKVKYTKVKVTSYTQTQKGDYKKGH